MSCPWKNHTQHHIWRERERETGNGVRESAGYIAHHILMHSPWSGIEIGLKVRLSLSD
jgi:hypothetical protein